MFFSSQCDFRFDVAHLIHKVVVVLLELCDLLLADRLQVVVQRVGSDDFDEVFHRMEDFHVLALSTSTSAKNDPQRIVA